ncbi:MULTISPECIES: site-specific DNA-methyltransferase [Halomonas]|uniref:site-specific DNA-methyltransferase n=1 Tax=Halomonas TaxID=2745 RepID=UPI001C96CEFD|nr:MULTISPECIES: site-specific DNA-methyltransferase [Halomonas]MBY6207477.1 site-specific DNA-methyltransferase [Halomonas sp. DP3Y7-2]MBY6228286.1 site-specific DNA-methyltransferase [Halomonas sp. DP3Y7-1]MCA0916351.1 site-specific DNA-methyltransferase [Halomonas denitrificans]
MKFAQSIDFADVDAAERTTSSAKDPVPHSLHGLDVVPGFSHGEQESGNLVIHGDNLSVMESLLTVYECAVKCIYIDPPYNNGEIFTHYSDRMSHDEWISSLKKRAEIVRRLLAEDGSFWVSIDDGGMHYLKVAFDEVFGRENFVSTIAWEHRTTRENRKVLSSNHEYILLYAKNYSAFKNARNKLPLTEEVLSRYKNPDNDPRGPWQSVSANVQAGHATASQFYEIVGPTGKVHTPPAGRCWIYSKEKMEFEISQNNIWFGRSGAGVPRVKKFLTSESAGAGLTPSTLWLADEVGTTDHAKKHLKKIFDCKIPFDTPKPESLIKRILHISTNPGDLVLDAYLGSGTTASVAHKMKRKYIGIENGEHAMSYCAQRLKAVIEGESLGISKDVGWSGGGGFTFLKK